MLATFDLLDSKDFFLGYFFKLTEGKLKDPAFIVERTKEIVVSLRDREKIRKVLQEFVWQDRFGNDRIGEYRLFYYSNPREYLVKKLEV